MEPENKERHDKDQMTILWNLLKDEQDWQRHNETQRASFSNYLLLIAGGLVAFHKDHADARLLSLCIIAIGIFGMVIVAKYWERFASHVEQARAWRNELDRRFFAGVSESQAAEPTLGYLATIRERARSTHNATTLYWLRDKRCRQYWLWILMFAFVVVIGCVLYARA